MKDMILLPFSFLLLVASADAKFKVRGATRALQQPSEEVCKLSSTPFTVKVAVALRGGITADDNVDGLLSSFRESFNISNKQACDAAHRRIVNAQLDSIEKRAGSEVTLLINIEGMYCADCSGDSASTATDGILLFGSTFDGVRDLKADEEQLSADSNKFKRKEKKQKENGRSAFKSKQKVTKAAKSKKAASYSPSESPTPSPTPMPAVDPCACTSPNARSAFDFKAVYQAALDDSQLSKFQVLYIDEVTYVTCDESIEYFDTIVIIELISPDGSIVPSDEVDLLGDSFVNSYNDLSIALCDDLFRSVKNVSLSVENVRRVLREDDSGRELGIFVFTGTAKIKGMCRGFGCSSAVSGSSGSTNGVPTDGTATTAVGLFSNRAISRRLDRHVVALPDTGRSLLNIGCVCGRTKQQSRAATAEEFVSEYDNTLNDLANQNLLRSVNGATGVTEVFSVDGCDNPTEEFDTVVLIELAAGDDAAVATEELNVLGDTFATDYNDLTAALCDPIFRRIGNISVEVENVRRRLVEDEGTIRELGTFVLTGKATIKGTCKGFGCSEQVSGSTTSSARPTASPGSSSSTASSRATGLFANKVASRRLLEALYPAASRNLASGCFCDERTADFRSPTDTEFVGRYNESISTLADKGVLENVRGALGVQQILIVSNCAEMEEEFFETALLVNVSAAFQPDKVVSDESFGDALIESYNELSTSLCDPWNRNLRKVSSLPDMSNRRLMGGMVSITLSGTCTGKGCSSTVYKHGILTRQLWEVNVAEQTNGSPFGASIPRVAEIDDDTLPVPTGCFCGTSDAEYRPPTESELISNAFMKIQQETEMVETIVARASASPRPASRLLRD